MTEPEIDRLVARSADANFRLGITGALVVAGNVFFQIIEGPPEAIDALYAKIQADPRHTDVVCVKEDTNAEVRLFPHWAMRRVHREASSATVRMEELVARIASPERAGGDVNELARLMRTELRDGLRPAA